jgi:hypothetical protein
VPRWLWPVHARHRLRLRVAPVRCVVAAAVAQVDATEEGDVQLGPLVVAQDHELLMVRPPGSHSYVEQALATGGIDLLAQVPVLRVGEGQAVPVRTPKETTNIDACMAASANTLPTSVSGVPVRRSSGSPRQSANINRSPSRIWDTRWFSSAKYVTPWMSGRTKLPSVHATPPP